MSLFLLENSVTNKDNNCFILIIKMKVFFACAVTMPTAHANSVLLSSFGVNL